MVSSIAVVLAAAASWAGARALVHGSSGREFALDGEEGPQKLHARPTPRIGGVAVAAGVLGGAAVDWAVNGGTWLLLLLCVAPGLVWGLIEDLSKRGAVFVRLALTALSAVLAFVLLDARITHVDLPVLDDFLALTAFSFVFTVVAVTGIAHAINVIDGLNGLSGATALFAAIGIAIVAWLAGDQWVFGMATVLAASILGFLVVNYPSGRIFLGDGGAYMIGLLLATLSVMLVHRNTEVSPWFPLLLLAYPVWETLFSMYRRRLRGHSTGRADALHLHSLVYHRVVRWKGQRCAVVDKVARNSLTSLCLWPIPLACFALAMAFWSNSDALQLSALLFIVAYVTLYRRIVRFGVPGRFVVRSDVASRVGGLSKEDAGCNERVSGRS